MHNSKFDDNRDKLYRTHKDKFLNKTDFGDILNKGDPDIRKKA